MVMAATLIAAGSVGQFQIGALAGEMDEAELLIEENAEEIEAIQRALIQRQGTIALDLERLKIEQKQQGDKLDDILLLLRRLPEQ